MRTNDKSERRTELHSLDCGPFYNSLIGIASFAFVILLENFYSQELLDFSLSDAGIPYIQKITPEWQKTFWLAYTELGGGKEQMVLFVAAFVLFTREKCLYYMCIQAIDKLYVNYFKLFYAEPRPYMIQPTIKPISCSKSFGNPSGHSSASVLIGVALFLDVFHGSTQNPGDARYFGKGVYFLFLFLAVLWSATIPFTRYLMGVHSLNQIVYGSSLGLCAALTMHFLARDYLLEHFRSVLNWHRLRPLKPAYGIKRQESVGSPSTVSRGGDETQEIQDELGESVAEPLNHFVRNAVEALVALIAFLVLVICTFLWIDGIMSPDSEKIREIKANWMASDCGKKKGELNMTYSLQNACLNGCGYQALFCSMYVCSIFRHSCGARVPVQDSLEMPKDNTCNYIKVAIFKVVVMGTMAVILLVPAVVNDVETVGSPIAIMFTNIVIPGTVSAIILVMGPYDSLVNMFQMRLYRNS